MDNEVGISLSFQLLMHQCGELGNYNYCNSNYNYYNGIQLSTTTWDIIMLLGQVKANR